MTKASPQGLTLIEVLVALAILGIGVMAAAQLQAASLRFSSQAELLKTSTQLAEGELEWRRQTEVFVGIGMPCESAVPVEFTCLVDVFPCNAVGSALDLTCATGLVNPVAYRISVSVEHPRMDQFSLETITTGSYVTGVIGTGDISPVDPEDPGEDPGDPTDPAPVPCIKWHPKQADRCLEWGD